MFNKIFDKFKTKEEIQPSAAPVGGRINYTFTNGLSAYQEQLNLGQDMELSQIALKLDLNASSLSNMKNLVETLIREKVLISFLKIILLPVPMQSLPSLTLVSLDDEIPEELLLSLKNDELENILMDFFSLNPKPIKLLKTIAGEAITLLTTVSAKNTEST